MKDLFTYPDYLGSDYINPDYLGNSTSGFYKRANDLKLGNYRAWGSGITPSQNIDETIKRMSMYHNAFLETWDENTIYKFWEEPLIEGHIELLSSDISSADTSTPINFTFATDHQFASGELVDATAFDSTLSPLNGNSYYVKKINDTSLQLSTNSGLTELLEYYVVSDDTVTSATAADPVVFTSVGYSSTGSVKLASFDGTMSKFNGFDFYMKAIDADTFNLSWDSGGTDVLGLSNSLTTFVDIDSWVFSTETITQCSTLNCHPESDPPTWSSYPKINLISATADQLSGSKINFELPTLSTPATVAAPNPTALNDYNIKGMSDNGDRFVFASGTTEDQVREWTGTEYEIAPKWATYATWWASTYAPFDNQLLSISMDGRYVVFDANATSETTAYLKLFDLDGTYNEKSIGSPNVAYPGGGNYLDVADSHKITVAQSNQMMMNIADYDYDGTDDKEGRIYLIAFYDPEGIAAPAVMNMVYNPYSGDNTDAQFGRSLTMRNPGHRNKFGCIPGEDWCGVQTFFATNHAANNSFSTNTRHEYYQIYGVGFGETATNHDTIIQNSGTTLTVASTYTLNGHEHIVDPKISGNGQRYVIAGTNGFQVYSLSGTTWSLHSEKATSDIKNVDIYFDGLTIKIQTATTIETYTVSGTTWTLDSTVTIADMDYMNTASGGYQFACARSIEVTNTTPKRHGMAVSAKTGVTSSTVKGYHESTGELINWYLNKNNSNTYYIKNTTTTDQYELYTNQGLTLQQSVVPVLSTQFATAQTMSTTDSIFTAHPECNIGDSTALVASTTGEILDNSAHDAWRVITSGGQTVTNGTLTISLTNDSPYHFSGTTLYFPGNLTYQKRTGESTYANGAIVGDNVWNRAATSSTTAPTNMPALTVNQDSSGYITSVTEVDPGTTADRWDSEQHFMLTFETGPDTYTPPALTPAEEEDVFETEDEWIDYGLAGGLKEWPRHVSPMSAEIVYNSPTIVNKSQSGLKYTRSSGHTAWRLDVTYPAMSAEDFQIFAAIAQAGQGQAMPFYFVLRNKDNNPILWDNFDYGSLTLATYNPRIANAITVGDRTMLVEGFGANEANAFVQGEVFSGGGQPNGDLHTSLSAADSNIFGEAKIRTTWPFRTSILAGTKMYKDPYQVIVTLASDDFEYQVDVNNYYYMSVSFDLDRWK